MNNRKNLESCGGSKTFLISLLAAILFFFSPFVCIGDLPTPGAAGDEPQDREQGENWENLQKDLTQFLKERKDVLKLYTGFNITASAGLEGHKSGENNLFQLDISGAVSKTLYPGEFRFETVTKLVFQNDSSQENVTLLKMSYEYYLTSWLETYGFIERFADSFLDIQQRYEFGGGLKAELNFVTNDVKPGQRQEDYHAVRQQYSDYIRRLEELAKHREDIDASALLTQLELLKKKEKMNVDALKRKRSLLTLGIAVSVFYELEKPETEPGYASNWNSLTRVSLRPSLILRPMEGITLSGYYYLKYPLFDSQKIDVRSDYRTDLLLRGKLDLSHDTSWAKNAALVFEFQRHYDNFPPQIGWTETGDKILAFHEHNEFKLKLEFGF